MTSRKNTPPRRIVTIVSGLSMLSSWEVSLAVVQASRALAAYDRTQGNIYIPPLLMAVPAAPPSTLQVTVYGGLSALSTVAVNTCVFPWAAPGLEGVGPQYRISLRRD